MTTLPRYVETLAALRDSDARTPPADRDRAVYAPESYGPARLVIPAPRRLARALVLPFLEHGEFFNLDGVLAARRHGDTAEPRPVRHDAAADLIVTALAYLPDLGGSAGALYRSMARLARLDPAQCRAVVLDALAVAHRTVKKYKRPSKPTQRPAPLTPAQRKAAQRERDRAAEQAAVSAFLTHYLADGRRAPGEHVKAADLYDSALNWLDEARELYDEARDAVRYYLEDRADYRAKMQVRRTVEGRGGVPAGPEPTPPERPTPWADIAVEACYPAQPPREGQLTRQRFYSIADGILGARKRNSTATYYLIPEPTPEEAPMTLDQLREEAALYKSIADEGERALRIREQLRAGEYAAALTEQRKHHRATGTHGAPVGLAAERARREAAR